MATPCAGNAQANNGSQIVLVEVIPNAGATVRLLFPGDATGDTTTAACQGNPFGERIDFLMASHHGSKQDNTNSTAWLDAVKPRSVVIPCGLHWTFCHPQTPAVCRFLGLHGGTRVSDAPKHVVTTWAKQDNTDAVEDSLKAIAGIEVKRLNTQRSRQACCYIGIRRAQHFGRAQPQLQHSTQPICLHLIRKRPVASTWWRISSRHDSSSFLALSLHIL